MNLDREQKLCDLMKKTMGNLSFDRAVRLCSLLLSVERIEGATVEFGCYKGDSAKLLAEVGHDKNLYLYDSFKGLPERSKHDIARADFTKGTFAATILDVLHNFKADKVKEPVAIIQKFFCDVDQFDLPKRISFAHIDADFYHSTMDALGLVYRMLSPKAVCVIDDYGWTGLPGVKIAVDEFMADKPEKVWRPLGIGYEAHQAIFHKL